MRERESFFVIDADMRAVAVALDVPAGDQAGTLDLPHEGMPRAGDAGEPFLTRLDAALPLRAQKGVKLRRGSSWGGDRARMRLSAVQVKPLSQLLVVFSDVVSIRGVQHGQARMASMADSGMPTL